MSWTKTNEAGIYRHSTTGAYRVLATAKSPLDGKMKQRRVTLNAGATMGEAITVREEVKAEIRNEGIAVTVASKSITLFASHWLARNVERGRWKARTARSNIQNFREHILPVIGHIPVDELTRDDVRRWVDYAEGALIITRKSGAPLPVPKPYAHGSLRRWWALLKHLVKDMYLEGYVDRRLVDWMQSEPGPRAENMVLRREDRSLARSELSRLLDVGRRELAADRWAELITLATTGMRAGELYGLDWECVDFGARSITIRASHSQGELDTTKTDEVRVAPMVDAVADALQEHRRELLRLGNPGLHDGIVFPSSTGGRRDAPSLHRPLQKIADLANIDVRVGPQVLRVTYITLSREAGMDPAHIKAITGHATEEMHQHYTRPTMEDLVASNTKTWG